MPSLWPRQGEQQQGEQQQGERQQDEQIEDQDHLEICPGYCELWEGLGPASQETTVGYFMRVKMKCLKQQQQKTAAE